MSATRPQPTTLATLSQRRRLVMLAVGGYALAILAQELLHLGDGLWVVIAVLGMLLTMTGAIQLMQPRRLGLPEGRDPHLDERQWQIVARAHTTAYRILGVAFILGSLYFYAAHKFGHLPLPTQDFTWLTIYIGAILFIPTLPTIVLAWMEPDSDRTP